MRTFEPIQSNPLQSISNGLDWIGFASCANTRMCLGFCLVKRTNQLNLSPYYLENTKLFTGLTFVRSAGPYGKGMWAIGLRRQECVGMCFTYRRSPERYFMITKYYNSCVEPSNEPTAFRCRLGRTSWGGNGAARASVTATQPQGWL